MSRRVGHPDQNCKSDDNRHATQEEVDNLVGWYMSVVGVRHALYLVTRLISDREQHFNATHICDKTTKHGRKSVLSQISAPLLRVRILSANHHVEQCDPGSLDTTIEH